MQLEVMAPCLDELTPLAQPGTMISTTHNTFNRSPTLQPQGHPLPRRTLLNLRLVTTSITPTLLSTLMVSVLPAEIMTKSKVSLQRGALSLILTDVFCVSLGLQHQRHQQQPEEGEQEGWFMQHQLMLAMIYPSTEATAGRRPCHVDAT